MWSSDTSAKDRLGSDTAVTNFSSPLPLFLVSIVIFFGWEKVYEEARMEGSVYKGMDPHGKLHNSGENGMNTVHWL